MLLLFASVSILHIKLLDNAVLMGFYKKTVKYRSKVYTYCKQVNG
jgi:hypothetical protein